MLAIEFDLSGFDDLGEKIAKRSIDLTPQLEVIGEDVINHIRDAFDSGNFQPLKDSTIKRKLAAKKTDQPLIYDGTWRRQHHVRPPDGTTVTVATDVPYAVFHVSDKPRKKIPLRNPYDLSSRGPLGDSGILKDCAARLAHYIATGEIT